MDIVILHFTSVKLSLPFLLLSQPLFFIVLSSALSLPPYIRHSLGLPLRHAHKTSNIVQDYDYLFQGKQNTCKEKLEPPQGILHWRPWYSNASFNLISTKCAHDLVGLDPNSYPSRRGAPHKLTLTIVLEVS